jgi:LacI family transcriptional regulator
MVRRRANGEDAPGRVRIQDVAELAGVSIATVSRVLNDHPDVSPSTRDEVIRYARELGYNGTRRTDAVNGRRTRLIALSVPSMRAEYVNEIVTGAVEALRDRDARLVICSVDADHDSGGGLREHLLHGMTDGALLVLNEEPSETLHDLLSSGYPVVTVESLASSDDTPAVATTNWAGAKTATEFLVKLGHTHIAVVTGDRSGRVTADRIAGYQAALLASGMPLLQRLVREADGTIEGGYEAARALLNLPGRPSAIFAFSDSMATGVLRAARELGLGVPRDLSVIGFDDVELASATVPALTTVKQPLHGLGRVAVDVLFRLLNGQPLDARRIELSTSLVVRESTAAPHGTSFLT